MKTVKFSLVLTGMMICLALVAVILITPANTRAREVREAYAVERQGGAETSAVEQEGVDPEWRAAALLQSTPLPPPPRPPTPTPASPVQEKQGAIGSLTGRVWDLFNDGPAANITVKVNDVEVVTDSEGRYALNELPVGTYEVAIQLPASGLPDYSSATVVIEKGQIFNLDLSFYSQPLPTPTPAPVAPPPAAASAISGSGRPSTEFTPGSSSPLTVYTGGPPMVWVNPEFVNHEMGRAGSITIDVADMSDFGGFQGELLFDPNLVEIQSVALGSLLESTGRQAGPLLAEVDNDGGNIFFGTYSSGKVAGPNGGGSLLIINFTTKNEGSSEFDLNNVVLSSRLGNNITASVFDGSIRASACFGDLNGDKVIDINDVQAVAGRVGQAKGDPNYDEVYDFNFNGAIDDGDVELVTARWTQTCQ